MVKNLNDVVVLDRVSPEQIYRIYMDSGQHSKITGQKVQMSSQAGAKFSAEDGEISGRNLYIIPEKMIVQSWRRKEWPENTVDAIMVMSFSQSGATGARIDVTNALLPQNEMQFINWNTFWNPLREYLEKKDKKEKAVSKS